MAARDRVKLIAMGMEGELHPGGLNRRAPGVEVGGHRPRSGCIELRLRKPRNDDILHTERLGLGDDSGQVVLQPLVGEMRGHGLEPMGRQLLPEIRRLQAVRARGFNEGETQCLRLVHAFGNIGFEFVAQTPELQAETIDDRGRTGRGHGQQGGNQGFRDKRGFHGQFNVLAPGTWFAPAPRPGGSRRISRNGCCGGSRRI